MMQTMKAKKGFVTDIESEAKRNTDFRRVLYTGKHAQIVLMSLRPKENIGEEVHETVDQFFRFEDGEGIVTINGVEHGIKDGTAVLVPSGSRHDVINTSDSRDLKLYTIYSPPNHRDKVVHHTKAEALADNERFDGRTSE